MNQFDVVIIGGGPAGIATALTILKKPGISVAVLEQSDYSKPRIGEVLSPGMRNLLEYFGVWEDFSASNSMDAFSSKAVWGAEEVSVTDYLFTLHGSGWHLDRVGFDRMMSRKFEALGGTLLTNTKFLKADPIESGWSISVRSGEEDQELTAKYLVDASGRRGTFVNSQEALRVMDDSLVGIGCFGSIDPEITVEQSILIEACEYGWWYSAPTPNQKMSVILMTDLDMVSDLKAAKREDWLALLAATKQTSQRVSNVQFADNPRSFLAYSSKLNKAGGDNWLAVGDALSSHDPLSSSGIPHALGSGSFAGRVVVAALQGNHKVREDYETEITNQYYNYLKTKRDYYSYEQRWNESKFWKRRNDSIGIMADASLKQPLTVPEKPIHLNTECYQDLKQLHVSGMPAHELISEFRKLHPTVADQTGILALQEMM